MSILKSALGVRSQINKSIDKQLSRSIGLNSIMSYYRDKAYDNVYPNVTKIANAFMTIKPYAIDSNGKPLKQANVIDKLYHPNQEMSSVSFRETLAVMALVHPKVYILVWHRHKGEPVHGSGATESNIAGFTFLENVSVEKTGGVKRYRVGSKVYEIDEVIEITSGVNPYRLISGYSPSIAAQKWAKVDDYIADYQQGLFDNGAVPSGQFIITAPSAIEFNDIVNKMEAKHRGAGNNNKVDYVHRPTDPESGKPVDAQVQWVPFAQTNRDMQLGELFNQANKKLDLTYGVPAEIKGFLQNSNYASVAVAEKIFIAYVVKPFATKIWMNFTNELNRITSGLGYAINFDLEIPSVADEDKVRAETKSTEIDLILRLLDEGYSLNSIVDACGLSNAYKLLKVSKEAPAIVNDKPDVDTGDEVQDSPSSDQDQNSKKKDIIHTATCSCEHCKHHHNHKSKDVHKITDNYIDLLAQPTRDFMNNQIERAIDEVTIVENSKSATNPEKKNKADKKERDRWYKAMMALLLALMLESGQDERNNIKSILLAAGISIELPKYEINELLKTSYGQTLRHVARSYQKDTAESIRKVLSEAQVSGLTRQELIDKLRDIMNTDEWRVQRLANSEAHRASSMAALDSMKAVEKITGRKFLKRWVTRQDNKVCLICAKLHDKTLPLDKAFVNEGGTLDLDNGQVFENKWIAMTVAQAHPNCRCKIEYILVDKATDEDFNFTEYDILPKDQRQSFFEDDINGYKFNELTIFNKSEQQAAKILSRELGQKVYAMPEVISPKRISMADFAVGSDLWEAKEVSSLRSVERNMRKATKQIKGSGGIILNATLSTLNDQQIIDEVVKRLKELGITQAIVFRDDEVIFKQQK